MAYTFRSVGTADQHNTSSGAIQGGQPAGVLSGDLLLINAVMRNNAYTLATPANWVQLSPNINDTYCYLFGRIADGTASDNFPALNWSGTAQAYGQMAAFNGSVPTSMTNIVHASVDESGAGAGASGNDIQYSALTITAANTLVIFRGVHNKTATGNGVTVDALAGVTQISQTSPNGSVFSTYWGYQIQTTATSINAVIQTRNNSGGGTAESLQQSSLIVSLKPLVTANAANKAFINNQQCINR